MCRRISDGITEKNYAKKSTGGSLEEIIQYSSKKEHLELPMKIFSEKNIVRFLKGFDHKHPLAT